MLCTYMVSSAEFNASNRVFSSVAIGMYFLYVSFKYLKLHNRCAALLYYDFLLTISLEVERYWTGRRSWASVFFFLNRYTAIVSHVPVMYEFFFAMSESVSEHVFSSGLESLSHCLRGEQKRVHLKEQPRPNGPPLDVGNFKYIIKFSRP